MLDIFTDNWDELPTLNEGERLVRIITDNNMDELYTIVTDDMDVDYEIRTALRFKRGRNFTYGGIEDQTYLYEWDEASKKDAADAWDGAGYYTIGWSDGGNAWTSDGPQWFDSEEELAAEIACAYAQSSDTHLPWAEKYGEPFQQYELDALLGDSEDDFDVDGIIDEATEMHDGVRYWVVPKNELETLIERHDRR